MEPRPQSMYKAGFKQKSDKAGFLAGREAVTYPVQCSPKEYLTCTNPRFSCLSLQMREEREKKCQPHSSAERSSASAQSIADPLLEGASEVSSHPKTAEVTKKGCGPAALAEHITTSGIEGSSSQPCTGPPRWSPAGVA